LIHTADCLLLFGVLLQYTGSRWRAFAVAALWGLNPLRTESVAWVSERKDVLSTLFFLLTLWAYGRYAATSGPKTENPAQAVPGPKPALSPSRNTRWFYALALAFFALGLMSKPMLVSLPFVLLLLDYWPLGRYRRRGAGQLLAEKLPFFLMSAASCVITLVAQQGAMEKATPASWLVRLQNVPISYCRYLEKIVWPSGLSFFYPRPEGWGWPAVIAAGCAVGLLSLCAVLLARARPYLPVGWFWLLGTLVPVIGLVQVGAQAMADRYTYIPSMGICLLAVWEGAALSRRLLAGGLALKLGLGVVLAAYLPMTWHEVSTWRNSEALARHALSVTRDNYLAHLLLAATRFEAGRTDEAIAEAREAARISPAYPAAHVQLGICFASERRLDEAVAQFEQALRERPNYPAARFALGNALYQLGRTDAAIAQFRLAIAGKPDYPEALNNLGRALLKTGQTDEAIGACQKAISLMPAYAMAHYNLSCALHAKGQHEDAVLQLRQAARLKPNLAAAHNDLGAALLTKGLFKEAVSEFERAAAAEPGNPDYHRNLGVALSSSGDVTRAMSQFEQALRLKPGDPRVTRLWDEARNKKLQSGEDRRK
jgi:tetratricopeptide (TPR) repeat protein